MIDAKSIEILKNLFEFDLEGVFYDFHNEFNCIKISHASKSLVFQFKHIEKELLVSMKFQNVILVRCDFSHFPHIANLTIDTIYRGRFETNGEFIESDNDGRSFLYIEFYEGKKMEFWCESILVEKE